jgi:hypothetical protein
MANGKVRHPESPGFRRGLFVPCGPIEPTKTCGNA